MSASKTLKLQEVSEVHQAISHRKWLHLVVGVKLPLYTFPMSWVSNIRYSNNILCLHVIHIPEMIYLSILLYSEVFLFQ